MKTLAFLFSILLIFGCEKSSSQKESSKLVLTGSSTIAPLAAEIGKQFEKENPGVRIDVQTGGSSRGIADVRKGLSNIGMASRALKESEKKLYAHKIALDGVCVILNSENSVEMLTDEQVLKIYTKKITNWKEVGGDDAAITVVNKAEGRSTLEIFAYYFKLKNSDIKPDVIIGDNEQGIKTVAGDKYAIGYVSIGTAEYNYQNRVAIKLLACNGITASTKTLAEGTFPISRPLNLVTTSVPEGLVKKFIDYCQSKKVYDLIKSQYFVPPVN